MRNTTMRDKLADAFTAEAGALSSERSNEEVLSAVSAVQRKMKKEERKPGFLLGPRYVTPPKRANPFSMHAYPASTFLTVDKKEPTETIGSALGVEAAKPLISLPVPEPASQESSHSEAAIPVVGDSPSPSAATPVPSSFPQSQTAYPPQLKSLMDSYAMAKSAIAFTLEQLHTRRKKTEEELAARQRDLESIDRQVEHEKENLRKIDEIIAASALLAEQVAVAPAGLLSFKGAHHKTSTGSARDPNQYANRWSDDPSILHIADVRKFFAEHPALPPNGKAGWDAAAIVPELPAIKQTHAKLSVPGMLKSMTDSGVIERVGRGLYKAVVSHPNE